MFGGWTRDSESPPRSAPQLRTSQASTSASPLRSKSTIAINTLENYEGTRIVIERHTEAPPILGQLVRYLLTKGANTEKIFQVVPPRGTEFETLRNKLNTEREALLLSSHTKNPHVVAELLKYYLSCLPEPVLTYDVYDRILLVVTLKTHEKRMAVLRDILRDLSRGHFSTSNLILSLLNRVSQSEQAQMPASALAEIFAEYFLRPSFYVFYRENDAQAVLMVMEWLIIEYEYLMKDNVELVGLPKDHAFTPPALSSTSQRAPAMLRKPSIRLQDISANNANRKPLFFLAQVKNFQDQQAPPQEDSTPETPATPMEQPSPDTMEETLSGSEDEENADLDKEEASQEEEDEYNEEESRKMDEMMGVIDVPEEPLLNEVVPLANEEDLQVPSVVPIVPEVEDKEGMDELATVPVRPEAPVVSALREDSARALGKNSNPMMQMNQVDPDMEFELVEDTPQSPVQPSPSRDEDQKATQFEEVEVDMD